MSLTQEDWDLGLHFNNDEVLPENALNSLTENPLHAAHAAMINAFRCCFPESCLEDEVKIAQFAQSTVVVRTMYENSHLINGNGNVNDIIKEIKQGSNTDEKRTHDFDTARIREIFRKKKGSDGKFDQSTPLYNFSQVDFLPLPISSEEALMRGFLYVRDRIEDLSIKETAVWLFCVVVLQFAVSWIVFGIGAMELKGGSKSQLLTAWAAGLVGFVSAILGFIASQINGEIFLRVNLVTQFWQLSLLVAYFYATISRLETTRKTCGGRNVGTGNGVSAATFNKNCKDDRLKFGFALAFSFAAIATSFLGTYLSMSLLDSINDRCTLADSRVVFQTILAQSNKFRRVLYSLKQKEYLEQFPLPKNAEKAQEVQKLLALG